MKSELPEGEGVSLPSTVHLVMIVKTSGHISIDNIATLSINALMTSFEKKTYSLIAERTMYNKNDFYFDEQKKKTDEKKEVFIIILDYMTIYRLGRKKI